MENFKKNWQIQHNWQLLFPVLGMLMLGYSSFRLADVIMGGINLFVVITLSIVVFVILLKLTLFLFKKLERKWSVEYRWEMIRVFIVFAITGSSSVFIGKPIIALIGITKENFNTVFYWILYILVGVVFYQILLVAYGWLFGQFNFFWEFEKKMLRRFGLEKFLN